MQPIEVCQNSGLEFELQTQNLIRGSLFEFVPTHVTVHGVIGVQCATLVAPDLTLSLTARDLGDDHWIHSSWNEDGHERHD